MDAFSKLISCNFDRAAVNLKVTNDLKRVTESSTIDNKLARLVGIVRGIDMKSARRDLDGGGLLSKVHRQTGGDDEVDIAGIIRRG